MRHLDFVGGGAICDAFNTTSAIDNMSVQTYDHDLLGSTLRAKSRGRRFTELLLNFASAQPRRARETRACVFYDVHRFPPIGTQPPSDIATWRRAPHGSRCGCEATCLTRRSSRCGLA